ncbi:MAG: SRPBCC family protein [Anaerolineae bacterium]|nr:SRPBCC family protein [Anaerolineae bacterium]
MEFELSAVINRPLEEVFAFFRDIDQHAGQKGTIVPVYDKVTPGPVGIGTQYREVVQVMPFVTGEILTEVVGYEPGQRLAYRFVALGMAGELTYRFEAVESGTRLVQRQSLWPSGWMRLFSPLIGATFSRMIARRLAGIKSFLESKAAD